MTRTTSTTTPHVYLVLVVVRVLLVERHFACVAQLLQKPISVQAHFRLSMDSVIEAILWRKGTYLKHAFILLFMNTVVLFCKIG